MLTQQVTGALPIIAVGNGLTLQATTRVATDWKGIQSLFESGVPVRELAEHFKLTEGYIRERARDHHWLTPHRVETLRREIEERQRENFQRTGKAVDVTQVKAEIWEERKDRWKERQAQIIDQALDGLADDPERAGAIIGSAKDLKAVVEVSRLLTGEAKEDEQKPAMAVNIGLLRSARPIDIIDVDVDE